MLPLPDSICKKVETLDYVHVDMAELCPKTWMFEDELSDKALASLFKRRRDPVTNILVWIQCYSSLVAVLAQKYPAYTPQLMEYLATICEVPPQF